MLDVFRRNPRYLRLWGSGAISQTGDSLSRIAVITLIGRLSELEVSGLLFGFEVALRMLPPALLGTLAGPTADRVPRRLLMVLADLLRAAIVLGLLLVDRPSELPLLYALLFAQMSVSLFAEAARTASLPNTVAREDLHTAYAIHAATWSSAFAVGSVLGGELVVALGIGAVFVFDAVTYLLSASLLVGLRLPPVPEHPERFRWRDVALATDLRRGLGHARSLGLGKALLAKTCWGVVGGAIVVLSLAGSSQRFGDVPVSRTLSVLFCARFVGTGLGPLLARRLSGSGDEDFKRQIAVAFGVGLLGYALFPLMPSLWLGAACVLLAHVGGSTIWVSSTTWWQRHVADAFRGRVYAMDFFGMTIVSATSALATGWLHDATGSFEAAVWSMCAALAATWAVWLAFAFRRRPARPADSAGAAASDGAAESGTSGA